MGARMKTIYVVDDEEITLKMAEFVLQQDGYDVVKCLSGLACLEHLKYDIPDLIILDVEMPIMSGIQTLDVIRSNEEFKEIPVMFLTGTTDSETVVAAKSLGAVGYVVKPFVPLELVDKVKKIETDAEIPNETIISNGKKQSEIKQRTNNPPLVRKILHA